MDIRQMKVCIILPCVLPVPATKGGAVEILTESLVYYNSIYKKLKLTVVTIYDEEAYMLSKKYSEVEWIFIKKNVLIKYTDYFFRALRRITKHTFKVSLYDYVVLNKIKNKKFDKIVFEGGNAFFAVKYKKYFPKEKMYYHFHSILRPNYKIEECFSNIFTISEYLKKEFLKSTSFKEQNVHVLLNGIRLENFIRRPDESKIRQYKSAFSIKEDDFVLIYVGRLIKEKGVHELIQAINKVNDKSIKLFIAGSGTGFNSDYVNEIKECAEMPDNIFMLGYVSNEQLYEYYHLADCFIMPSICEEGAGLVQSEAYAAGIPAIVSDRGGIPEYRIKGASMVVEYGDEFVINLQKAIIDMKLAVKNRQYCSKDIQEEIQKYSDEEYYLNYVKLLQK